MNKLLVMTIVGTRPEIIRLSRVMAALDKYCEHVIVHTGQNYDFELSQIFYDDLHLRKPDYFLDAAGETPCETIGKIIIEAEKVVNKVNPQAVLVLGDTNSVLAALVAKRKKIPVFHMEAGNRCFDQRVPEEINRKIVDHLADINLTYSTIARDYLIQEGFPADRVIKTGSPMSEVLSYYSPQIEKSGVLKYMSLEKGSYFLVSCHREENIDAEVNFTAFANVLNHLVEKYDMPVIVSTHPRTRKKIESSGLQFSKNIQFLKPLGFTDYVHLQIHARAVLSDSGTITEESTILNFPALNIREAHERPEGMEEGAVMLTGMNWMRISQSLDILADQGRGDERQLQVVRDYQDTNVSDKVLRIIHSYTDYVNRKVWHKR